MAYSGILAEQPKQKDKKPGISACIIAYNSKAKIETAIRSVCWCNEIVVADCYSTDGTAELAEQLGARVIRVKFSGFGSLRNKALDACDYEWVLSVDTDEYCTNDLQDEILATIQSSDSLDVYHICIKSYFMGRWIKYSGWYPNYRQPQLFRHHCLRYKNDMVHEGYLVYSDKPIGYLKNTVLQMPFQNISEMIQKSDRYSTLSVDRIRKKYKKASMTRAIIHGLWLFMRNYVMKRGFLDGWPGFMIAVGDGYSAFYRYAKFYESELPHADLSIPWHRYSSKE